MDERGEQALIWAKTQLNWPEAEHQVMGSDASHRRYFRLTHPTQRRQDGTPRTWVVMDAPPQHESLTRFVDRGERLARAGLHVPMVAHVDFALGFAVLRDLGDQPWHRVLNADNADAKFKTAITALVQMQAHTDTRDMAHYDAPKLLSELGLFTEWFLGRHWQVEPSEEEAEHWDLLCAQLLRWALDQPQCFCHRDFMPRNLMLCEPNPAIIDFQDALIGPISYDPVCLFRDAFLSWPPAQVDHWLEHYRQEAIKAGLPVLQDAQLWQRSCDFMSVQRHLKVIGIFARIAHRDGKPAYLEDVPRFFTYLDQAAARNPELQGLSQLLRAWRQRAVRLQ